MYQKFLIAVLSCLAALSFYLQYGANDRVRELESDVWSLKWHSRATEAVVTNPIDCNASCKVGATWFLYNKCGCLDEAK